MSGTFNYDGYGLPEPQLRAVQAFVAAILDTGGLSNVSFGGLTDASSANLPIINTPLATALAALQTAINAIPTGGTGGSGASDFASLSDKTTANLPSINTPLATALAAKATTSALTSGLATKADASAMTTALAAKADASATTASLATKADKVSAPATIASNVIDPAQPLNELLTLAANATLTFGTAPANGTFFSAYLKNTATNSITVTIPSTFSMQQQANITSFVMPASSEAFLTFRRNASSYTVWGEPIPYAKKAIAATFATGANDTQVLCQYMPHAGTINSIVTKSASGTATYTTKIEGVAVTATPNAVSSTEQIQAVTGNNVFAAGDTISVTRSADSTAVDVAYTLLYTPTAP